MSLYRGPSIIGESADNTVALVLSAISSATNAANAAAAANTSEVNAQSSEEAAAASALQLALYEGLLGTDSATAEASRLAAEAAAVVATDKAAQTGEDRNAARDSAANALVSENVASDSAANALVSENVASDKAAEASGHVNAASGQADLAANAAATTQTLRDSIIATQGAIGYLPPVAYAAGLSMTLTSQTVSYSGQAYAPILSALPFTTSGTFETAKFRLIQGVAAVDLATATGAGMVGVKASGSGAVQRTVEAVLDDTLHPKNYGVIANGVADDWAAWAAFFAAYAARTYSIAGGTGLGGTSSYTAPTVAMIAGRSLLSKPLVLPAYLHMDMSNILFDRHATWAEVAGTYLITSTSIYQAKLGGLSFRGVNYALELKNPNLDQGHIHVSGVKFAGGDNAIRVECRSSQVTISDFKADKVPHFLLNVLCDGLTLRDGWISQGVLTAAKDATITNQADLTIENVLGVPIQHTGAEVAWINNYKHVDISKMRFGGEPGSCAAINNFATAATTYPISPTSVQLTNSQTYSVDTQGSTQTSCVIRLFALPNVLRFRSNRGALDTQSLITWGSTADQAAELAKAPFCVLDVANNQYRLSGTPYPANLKSLFEPSSRVALTKTSFTSGVSVSDTAIIPLNGKLWDLVIAGNPREVGSSLYLSTWRGVVSTYTGYNGATIVRRIGVLQLHQTSGGPAFASPFTVTATFWDGATALAEVPAANVTATLRITISGWEVGQEGASLKAYLLEVTP